MKIQNINELEELFTSIISPRRVAFVGASGNPSRIGGRAISYTRANGFDGELLPVNPNHEQVQGLPAYASVDDIPGRIDLSILSVPYQDVPEAIRASGRKGAKLVLVYASNFAEVGEEGRKRQEEIKATAKASSVRLLGPNCLGFLNCRNGLAATFSGAATMMTKDAGGLTIVSQSGAFGAHAFAAAIQAGARPGLLLTTGNEADLNVASFIHMAALDPETEVIGVYTEGVANGEELIAALDAARAAKKPVLIFKAGKSEVGAAAAVAHTAALAGEDRAFDAILKCHGAIRVQSHEHLIDVALAARQRIYPVGKRLGVISVSGGGGIILADAASDYDVSVPELPASRQALLKKFTPFSSMRNPLDVTAQVANDLSIMAPAANALFEDNFCDAAICYWATAATTPETLFPLIDAVEEGTREYGPRLVLHSGYCDEVGRAKFTDRGLTIFDDPVRTVRAMSTLMEIGVTFSQQGSDEPVRPAPKTIGPLSGNISESEASKIFSAGGIPMAQATECTTPDEAATIAARSGGRFALKVLSADILHKSDVGGVLLDVPSDQVGDKTKSMLSHVSSAMPNAKIEGVLISPMIAAGVDCIAGVRMDPVFGPLVIFGIGGIFVEILDDVSIRPAPLKRTDALEMIGELKAVALLRGARGAVPADEAAIADVLLKLSDLAMAIGTRLEAIEINPLRILPDGSPLGLDALITTRNDRDEPCPVNKQ